MKGAHAILISIFLSLCNAEFNPYEVGPYGVKTTEISKWDVSHTLHVWSPDTEGYFPLVYGLTGFAGKIKLKSLVQQNFNLEYFRTGASKHWIYRVFAYCQLWFYSGCTTQVPHFSHFTIWRRVVGKGWRMGAKKLGPESHWKRYVKMIEGTRKKLLKTKVSLELF